MDCLADITVGQVVSLSSRLARLTAPNPSAMTGAGTNTYIVGVLAKGREVIVVDPGPAIEEHVERIVNAIQTSGAKLKAIWVTHTHRDHSPAAMLLKQRFVDIGYEVPCCGVAACKGSEKQFQDESFKPDSIFKHGEITSCSDFSLEVIHTPGHVSNHYCFLLKDEGILLAGDHMMQGSTVAIVPPQGDMLDYLNSLTLLKIYPLKAVAPAHGTLIFEPFKAIDQLIKHRLWRENKLIDCLQSLGVASIVALLPCVYDDVDSSLHWAAKFSMLAHLEKLRRESRVNCDMDLSDFSLDDLDKIDQAVWQWS